MKFIRIGIEDVLWDKFVATFEATAADFLIDEGGKALKDPSVEDMETAEENAIAETAKRGQQWLRVFVVNGVRGRIMPEALAKAEDDDNAVAIEGLELRKTLKAMTVQVDEV